MSLEETQNGAVLIHRVGAVETDLREHKDVAFRKFDRVQEKFDGVNRDIAQISAKVAANMGLIAVFQTIAVGIVVYFLTRGL